MSLHPVPLSACAAGALLVAACSHGAPAGLRLQLRTVADWPQTAVLAERVAQVAGVPVRDATALSTRSFAVTLQCADAAGCAAARERLAAQTTLFERVQEDARVPTPSRPDASTAR